MVTSGVCFGSDFSPDVSAGHRNVHTQHARTCVPTGVTGPVRGDAQGGMLLGTWGFVLHPKV